MHDAARDLNVVYAVRAPSDDKRSKIKNKSKTHFIVLGENRTPVPATTMRDTNHYTTRTAHFSVIMLFIL